MLSFFRKTMCAEVFANSSEVGGVGLTIQVEVVPAWPSHRESCERSPQDDIVPVNNLVLIAISRARGFRGE